jgi:acetyl-CoA acetyltransferase
MGSRLRRGPTVNVNQAGRSGCSAAPGDWRISSFDSDALVLGGFSRGKDLSNGRKVDRACAKLHPIHFFL